MTFDPLLKYDYAFYSHRSWFYMWIPIEKMEVVFNIVTLTLTFEVHLKYVLLLIPYAVFMVGIGYSLWQYFLADHQILTLSMALTFDLHVHFKNNYDL